MQLFIKRFWGFDPEMRPLITFSAAVYRDKLLRESKPGDRIAFVATKNDKPAPEERGKLLGMAEIGRRAVDTLDLVDPALLSARDWEGERLRFPKAIPMVRAWRLGVEGEEPPDLLDVIERQLPRSAISNAILLNDRDAAAVMAYPARPVVLPDIEAIRRERDIADRFASLQPSRGPAQVPGQRNFEVPERDFGFVYALRFGQRDVWKIGNSYDPDRRADAFNRNIPFPVTGEQWDVVQQQKTNSPDLAHDIENRAKTALAVKGKSIGGEMFECDQATLEAVWRVVVVGALMGD